MRLSKEQRGRLRGAAYSGDGERAVRAIVEDGLSDDALQLSGDGLLAALAQGVDDGAQLARRVAAALRDREWDGDEELADQLEAALGVRPTPLLRPLPVDLDELSGALEGDPRHGGGRVELTTGEVWNASSLEYAVETEEEDEDDLDDPERWLWIECVGSRPSYRDMEAFIATIDDTDRADRLGIAIQGSGAFRRFKDVLSRWPDDFERWFAFSEDRQRGRARKWLADSGYRPVTARKGA
jgi:hypothetical protein